jgi:hypothetical protein
MQNLNQLLKLLLEAKIDFVLIGGYAGVVHGCTQLTRDLDICAALTDEDIKKLRDCLKDYNPKLRMNPNFKPSFMEQPKSTKNLNAIYLETDIGVLDILKSVIAIGDFSAVKRNAQLIDVFGLPCQVISIDDLIKAKKAMNRDKDKLVLKELELVREKLKK